MTLYILRVAALLLCSASIIYTVLLCMTFADTPGLQAVAAGTGLALELVKFALFPIGLTLWRKQKRFAASASTALGALLLAMSYSASVSFFAEANDARDSRKLAHTTAHRAWEAQLTAISERITLLQQSAAVDLENGYRARANDTLTRLSKAEQERALLLTESPVAQGQSTQPIRPQVLYSIVAALIELCAIAALVLPQMAVEPPRVTGTGPGHAQEATKDETAPRKKEKSQCGHDKQNEEETLDKLSQALRNGSLTPSYRAIARYLKKGHRATRSTVQKLIQRGVLAPKGRSLQLAQCRQGQLELHQPR